MDARDLEGPVAKVLIFNTTGERDEYSLLPKLVVSVDRLLLQMTCEIWR